MKDLVAFLVVLPFIDYVQFIDCGLMLAAATALSCVGLTVQDWPPCAAEGRHM